MRQSAHGHTHQGVRGWGGGGRLQLPQQLYNKYISHDIVAATGWWMVDVWWWRHGKKTQWKPKCVWTLWLNHNCRPFRTTQSKVDFLLFCFFFFISPLASRRVVCKSNQKSFCMKINTTLKDTSLRRHLSLKIKSCFSGSPAVMALCVNSSSRTGPEQNSSENKSFHFDQVLFCV